MDCEGFVGSEIMRVLSVNANNRLSKFIDDISVEYDVLLVQEWARHGKDGDFASALSKLPENSTRSVTEFLLIEANEAYEVTSWNVLHEEERVQILEVNGSIICNVYLPASSSKQRRELMEYLRDVLLLQFRRVSLIMGDFNLAPRMKDGWFGDQHSAWTKNYERETFASLCETYQLLDFGADVRWNATFKRMNNGKMTAFRCDLAIGNPEEWMWDQYVHELRTQKKTDHSGILVRRISS